jgi:hypothetical protein
MTRCFSLPLLSSSSSPPWFKTLSVCPIHLIHSRVRAQFWSPRRNIGGVWRQCRVLLHTTDRQSHTGQRAVSLVINLRTLIYYRSVPGSSVRMEQQWNSSIQVGGSYVAGTRKPGFINHLQTESESKLPPISSSWRRAPWDPRPVLFSTEHCSYSPYVTSSLTRRWVCRLQLLLVLARAAIPGSESSRTHGPYFNVSDSRISQPGGSGPRIYTPRNRMARLQPQVLSSIFTASYDLQGYAGGIRTRLHTGKTEYLLNNI